MNSKSSLTKIEEQIPEKYEHLVSERQYFRILAYICRYFEENNYSLTEITEGSLIVLDEQEKMDISLDNLIKRLSNNAEEGWKQDIYTYFDQLLEHTNTEELFANFELAKEYLTLRLYGDQIDTHSEQDALVFRQDLAGTYSVLSLDLPTKFQVILKSEIENWSVDEETLFQIALQNANQQAVETAHGYWEETEILAVFSNEYAAIKLLELEQNFEDSVGEHGALAAVPTKGTVFIHPMRSLDTNLNEALSLIIRQGNLIYESDPGPITRNLYWYHQGQFYAFNMQMKEEGLSYQLPTALEDYLDEHEEA
ncbi:MAG: hypothetical protein HRU41_41315 [Saprospiraceae bacterium]|nr:hypothetical protein [Saprospiraceae bacterium]